MDIITRRQLKAILKRARDQQKAPLWRGAPSRCSGPGLRTSRGPNTGLFGGLSSSIRRSFILSMHFLGGNGLQGYLLEMLVLLEKEKGSLSRFGSTHPSKYRDEAPTAEVENWSHVSGCKDRRGPEEPLGVRIPRCMRDVEIRQSCLRLGYG